MPYCGKCGIEVDNGVAVCPLCQFQIPEIPGQPPVASNYPPIRLPVEQAPGRKRRVAWRGLSFCILASFIMVLTADLVKYGEITWSRFALSALGYVWLLATWLLLLFRYTWIVYLFSFGSTAGFLALVDVCHKGLYWFLPLGLPIATMVFSVVMLMHGLFRYAGLRGGMITGIFFLLLIPFCFGLELLISGFMGRLGLSWSFVVLSVVGPLAVFLFYYHVKLAPQIDLKRLFHV